MSINIDWPRWTVASILQHFHSQRGDNALYLEGDERDTNKERAWAELRVDGPFFTNPCKGLHYIDVEINVLVQAHMDLEDLYAGLRIAGFFTSLFTNAITVRKYGDGVNDDDTLLGCLIARTDRSHDTIDLSQFGIIRPDTRLKQYTIEGHYRMELHT